MISHGTGSASVRPMTTMAQVNYRWLAGSEIQTLVNPICKTVGWPQLNVNVEQPTSAVIGAFEDFQLIGFLALQLFPMVGPGWVDAPFRNGVISRELADRMHEFLKVHEARGWLVIADTMVTQRLAERHGMESVDSPVYMGRGE